MDKFRIVSHTTLIISIIPIFYALMVDLPPWIVYGISLIFIPLFILSLGLISMARAKKEEKEGRVKEPFIGY